MHEHPDLLDERIMAGPPRSGGGLEASTPAPAAEDEPVAWLGDRLPFPPSPKVCFWCGRPTVFEIEPGWWQCATCFESWRAGDAYCVECAPEEEAALGSGTPGICGACQEQTSRTLVGSTGGLGEPGHRNDARLTDLGGRGASGAAMVAPEGEVTAG